MGPKMRLWGPWAGAHGPGPMGQGPWAKAHGPGPWARPKVFASGARAGPGPKPAKKIQKNRLFGKIETPEKGHFWSFLSKCPNVNFFCPSIPPFLHTPLFSELERLQPPIGLL